MCWLEHSIEDFLAVLALCSYTNIQIYKYTNIQIYKYTNTQIHKYQGFHWVDQLLSLDICLHGDCPDGKGDQITRFENQVEAEFSNAPYFYKVSIVSKLLLANRGPPYGQILQTRFLTPSFLDSGAFDNSDRLKAVHPQWSCIFYRCTAFGNHWAQKSLLNLHLVIFWRCCCISWEDSLFADSR